MFKSKKQKSKGKKEALSSLIHLKQFGFESKKIGKWRHKDIIEWFRGIGFGDAEEQFMPFFEEKTGDELLYLDKSVDITEELDQINVRGVRKKMFLVYYQHLKECAFNEKKKNPEEEFFTLKFHTVFQKFCKSQDLGKYSVEDMEEHCSILCDHRKILRYLLNCPSSYEKEFDVKLIINECQIDCKNLKSLKKKVYESQDVKVSFPFNNFGNFQISVFFGPFYLQWTNEEIIIPIHGKGIPIKMLLDTDPIIVNVMKSNDFKTAKRNLAIMIEKWNSSYTYADQPQSKIDANCQTFLNDVFQTFKTDLDSSPFCFKRDGAYKMFLPYLPIRNSKKSDLIGKVKIEPCEEFVETFDLKSYPKYNSYKRSKDNGKIQILFETHAELDEFLFHLNQKNTAYFPTEHKLLKAIDRAFWIRNFAKQNDPKYKPLPQTTNKRFPTFGFTRVCGCCFKDPLDKEVMPKDDNSLRRIPETPPKRIPETPPKGIRVPKGIRIPPKIIPRKSESKPRRPSKPSKPSRNSKRKKK